MAKTGGGAWSSVSPQAAIAASPRSLPRPPPLGPHTRDYGEWSFPLGYGVEHALLRLRHRLQRHADVRREHWIPTVVRHHLSIVLIHGGYGQGSDWYSTPDGRPAGPRSCSNRATRSTSSIVPARDATPTNPSCTANLDREELRPFGEDRCTLGKSATDPEVAQSHCIR